MLKMSSIQLKSRLTTGLQEAPHDEKAISIETGDERLEISTTSEDPEGKGAEITNYIYLQT